MLVLCIDKLLKAKGILKPYTWLRAQKITHNMAYKLLNKNTLRLPIDIINTICEAAWCTPADLFEWTPDTPLADQPTHPLQALRPKPTKEIHTQLQKLSPQQLAHLQDEIRKMV